MKRIKIKIGQLIVAIIFFKFFREQIRKNAEALIFQIGK